MTLWKALVEDWDVMVSVVDVSFVNTALLVLADVVDSANFDVGDGKVVGCDSEILVFFVGDEVCDTVAEAVCAATVLCV